MKSVICCFLLLSAASSVVHSVSPNCTDWRTLVDDYGVRIFMLGDREYTVPISVEDTENRMCPRLTEASEKVKGVLKSCLKPFPKTVAGMITRGARKENRMTCSDPEKKSAFVTQLRCIRGSKIVPFHDAVDKYIKKLSEIGRRTPDNKKIDVVCCEYQILRKEIEDKAKRVCTPASVTFLMRMVDGMLREALDFLCYRYQNDNNLCKPIIQEFGVSVPTGEQENKSFLLPLIDVLTAAGEAVS